MAASIINNVRYLILVFSLLLCLSFVYSADITECTNISIPGDYFVTSTISNSATSNCITINANNVLLDCNGNLIDGDDSAKYGIYIYRSSAVTTNITVKNCVLSDWNTSAIINRYANGNTYENLTLSSNPINGILVQSSSGFAIRDSYLFQENSAIQLEASTFGTIENLLITDSGQLRIDSGATPQGTRDSTNVNITNLTSVNNTYGLLIRGDYHLVENSSFTNNGYGIYHAEAASLQARYSTFRNNEIIGSTTCGLSCYTYSGGGISNNNYYNNYFNNSINFQNLGIGTFSNNKLNTDLQLGENILGGTNLGGNFWATPAGDGFSETCTDSEPDGICDSSYSAYSSYFRDYYPLTYPPQGASPSSNLPNVTKFGVFYGTTNFSVIGDVSNVPNMKLANVYSSIVWNNNVDAENADYDSNIEMGYGFVSVNSAALDSSINSSANVTLSVAGCDVYTIYYADSFYTTFDDIKNNGQVCDEESSPACTDINCVGNTLTFTVDHFDGYGGEGSGAVPEFSTWAMIIAILGASVGFVFIRRND